MTTPLAPQAVIEEMAKGSHNSLFIELWDDIARNSISRASHIQSVEAALQAARDMGWVLVPIEPTEKMELAALEVTGEKQKETHDEYEGSTLVDLGMCKETAEMLNIAACEHYRKIYAAMLSAANGEG